MKILVVQSTAGDEFLKAVRSLKSGYPSYEVQIICDEIGDNALKESSIQIFKVFKNTLSPMQRKIQALKLLRKIRREEFDIAALTSNKVIPSKLLLIHQLFVLCMNSRKRALLLDTGDIKYISNWDLIKDIVFVVFDAAKLILIDVIVVPIFLLTFFSTGIIDAVYKIRRLCSKIL